MGGIAYRSGELRVETIFGIVGSIGDVEAEPPQAGRADQNKERFNRLDAVGKIAQSRADEISPRKSVRELPPRAEYSPLDIPERMYG